MKPHISLLNDSSLMIFISKLSGEPQDVTYKGNITTSTTTENLLFLMQIRSHDQQMIYFLNVAVIDLQRYQYSSQ